MTTTYLWTWANRICHAVVWHGAFWGLHCVCWTGYDAEQVSSWGAGSICGHEAVGLQHPPHAEVGVGGVPGGVTTSLGRIVFLGYAASTSLVSHQS